MSYRIRHSATDEPSRALAAADPQLGAAIDAAGDIDWGPIDDPFYVIERSIVSQQLSERVAEIIIGRLAEFGATTPQGVLAATDEQLRGAGLSARKVEYLRGIAQKVVDDEIDFEGISALDDEAAIEELTKLRGVGRWTAEMFLIFAMCRPDVLALDDMGVRISAGKLMGLGRAATREELEERAELWKPYRSVASFWLWKMQ